MIVDTIDPKSQEDELLRQNLHNIRLDAIMREHEIERTEIQTDVPCLFCSDTFTGTWHQYLQWIFEQHQFNPGRPSNLIYISELISMLRSQLDSNTCIYCQTVFPNQRTLRSHMRKKKHMRIPNNPVFDRYYMVNYRDLNQEAWQNHRMTEESCERSISDPYFMEPLEMAAADFDDTEINETSCLLCSQIFPSPEECRSHMLTEHNLDIGAIRLALDDDFYNIVRFVNYSRYMKAQNRCFVCGNEVVGDYVQHVQGHQGIKTPEDLSQILGEDQLLIPYIDGDPLLWALEDY